MSNNSKNCTLKIKEKLPKMVNNGEFMTSTVKFGRGENFLSNLELEAAPNALAHLPII